MIISNKEESLNPDWIRWPQGGVLALLYTCALGKFLSLSKAVSVQFSSVQSLSCVRPQGLQHASLSITNSWSLL